MASVSVYVDFGFANGIIADVSCSEMRSVNSSREARKFQRVEERSSE